MRNHETRVMLTEEQMEEIAERAAEKAIERMTQDLYVSIGKGVVRRGLIVLGIITTALALWLLKKGIITLWWRYLTWYKIFLVP